MNLKLTRSAGVNDFTIHLNLNVERTDKVALTHANNC